MNKQRRAILNEWEATDITKCWLVVWLAFREKGNVVDFPTPQLFYEWTDLRYWARAFLKAHSNVTGNPYNIIFDAHSDDILIVHFLDEPNNIEWPLHNCQAPITIPDLAQCISALAPRTDRFVSLP